MSNPPLSPPWPFRGAIVWRLREFDDGTRLIEGRLPNDPEFLCAEIEIERVAPDCWRLAGLHVPPSWRRSGVASDLIVWAIGYIEEHKAPGPGRIFIEVIPFERDYTAPAHGAGHVRELYRSYGFEEFAGHPYAMWRRA